MSKLIDITGRRYGRLVVIERAGSYYSPSYRSSPLWRCRCDCGAECVVSGDSLRSGRTRSCGCLRADMIRARNSGPPRGK